MSYQEYRKKWDSYPTLCKVDRMPLHLDIEVTTRCNLRCIMCEQSFNPPLPLDLDVSLLKEIIDEFAEKGGYSIKFCYLGEPLLYKPLFDMIKYAKNRGIIDTMIATNGNLLSGEKIMQTIQSGLDLVIFSVDSIYPEIYKKIRVKGDLDSVKRGVIQLNVTRQVFNLKKPKIQVQAIPMDLNKVELESGEYIKYWKEFADEVRISPYCEDYAIVEPITDITDFNCTEVWRRMTVRADGFAQLCCGERKDDKILGDLRVQSIEEIWNGKRFKKIRELMKQGNSHLINECKTCPWRERYVRETKD